MPDRPVRSLLLASCGLVLSVGLTAAALNAQTNGHEEKRSSEAPLRSGHFRTSDGVQLHYLEAGSGPTLVFVPAWTLPAWIWRPQLEHFSASYHVVALDPRGQGDSEKATEGYTAARLGRDIHELLEHLGGGPAVLVGWSLGVDEVLRCVSQFGTGDIRAVVLVDQRLHLPRDSTVLAQMEKWLDTVQRNRAQYTRAFVRAIHHRPQPESYLDGLTEAALSMPTNAAALEIANWYFFDSDLRPIVDSLDRPVLFVFSPAQVTAAEEARERWPGVPVKVIDGTGHALFRDRPEEFDRVPERFLARLPEAPAASLKPEGAATSTSPARPW